MLNGSFELCRVTGEMCPEQARMVPNSPTEAAWLNEARSESEKLIRSSVEALILLQWHCNLGDTREMSAQECALGLANS